MRPAKDRLFDIPLILTDKNVVTEDRMSWEWMVEGMPGHGVIRIPRQKKQETPVHHILSSGDYGGRNFAGRFEQGYNCFIPRGQVAASRSYWECNIDLFNYADVNASLSQHSPLNFHDRPITEVYDA